MDSSLPGSNRATNPELHEQVNQHFSGTSPRVDTIVPEPLCQAGPGPGSYPKPDPTHCHPGPASGTHVVGVSNTCTHQNAQLHPVVYNNEEISGIKLVYTLLSCAEAVQCGQLQLASSLIYNMNNVLLPCINTSSGIGKIAGYFIHAVTQRLNHVPDIPGSSLDSLLLYKHFYQAGPYIKFGHFTANQVILEAFKGWDFVHIVDLCPLDGLQWTTLIEALAFRTGGPPFVRLTGVGLCGENGLNSIGKYLSELARSMNVRFEFRAVVASRLDEIKPWMVKTNPNEALVVNSILQLHRVIGSGIDPVLNWIRNLNPKVVTNVEQEANHNQADFLSRFTEALCYYSTMLDSIEACQLQPYKTLAELSLAREISNIVGCEDTARIERHEPFASWKARMVGAGFRQVSLGENLLKEASMLVSLFSAEGHYVELTEGSLKLGWHSRPLIAASAWEVEEQLKRSTAIVQDGSSSSTSPP